MLAERGATATWGWTVELPLSDGAGVVPAVIVLACRRCGFPRLHVDPEAAFDSLG